MSDQASSRPQGFTREEDTRLTIRLSPKAREAVNEIIKLGDYRSVQEAIRRAIGDELLLLRYRNEDWTILLKKGDEYREMVWSDG